MGHIQPSQPGVEPLLKSMSIADAKGCDAKTLAVIAAQFIARGDDEKEALRKANALYLKASAYTKQFTSLPVNEKAIEAFPEEALVELAELEDLAIGDSEANSPALKHFRETSKTKLDRAITYKKFVNMIEHEFGQKPEKITSSILENLHALLRQSRSRARAERRKKSVKKNRTKSGV